MAVVMLRRRDVRADSEPILLPGGVLIPVLACLALGWVMYATITLREWKALGIVAVIALGGYLARQRQRA